MTDANPNHPHPSSANPLRIPNLIGLIILGLLVLAPLVVDLHGEPEADRVEFEAAAAPDGSMSPELADAAAESADDHEDHGVPPFWQIGTVPFVLLLLSIAVLPLLRKTMHWWEDNTNRLAVALGAGLLTMVFYAVVDGPTAALLAIEHAIPGEYIPFIMLLFSLYVISGGISITGDLKATPTVNATFILVGTLIASFIGTTGASMLLIRPLLETNRERKHVVHTVVFFIFLVSNIGGTLLPSVTPRSSWAISEASPSTGRWCSGRNGRSSAPCSSWSTGSGTRSWSSGRPPSTSFVTMRFVARCG